MFPYAVSFRIMSKTHEKLMSSGAAAVELGVTERRVRQLCEAGRIGRRVDGLRDWILTAEEVERLKKSRQSTAG